MKSEAPCGAPFGARDDAAGPFLAESSMVRPWAFPDAGGTGLVREAQAS